MKTIPDCKKFSGFKPCDLKHDCWTNGCDKNEKIGTRILIINLDAMGDVLMTTAQLKGIKRKYKDSTITWITLKNASALLFNNPYVDKVYEYNFESVSILNQMQFDVAMNVDKSQRSAALIMSVASEKKLGFGLNENGKIIPLNEGANYNYLLGMDDILKFNLNKKTGEEYLAETFELDYKRDEYIFEFTEDELKFIGKFKEEVGITSDEKVIGFNTGCSNLYPNKKMTLEQHSVLIEKFLSLNKFKLVLIGGPEDKERNSILEEEFKGQIINTPTNMGIRKGACFANIPDLIITGDSFGMHLAIALKKHVIAWFGLSCWSEIDLFDRGVKLYSDGLHCSPCWKKECSYNLECIQMIDLERIINCVLHFYKV